MPGLFVPHSSIIGVSQTGKPAEGVHSGACFPIFGNNFCIMQSMAGRASKWGTDALTRLLPSADQQKNLISNALRITLLSGPSK